MVQSVRVCAADSRISVVFSFSYDLDKSRRIETNTSLFIGIAIAFFFFSFGLHHHLAGGEKVHGVVFWLMGGLWGANWTKVEIITPVVILGIGIIFSHTKDLNAMLLGG